MGALILIALAACSPLDEAKGLVADFAEVSYCEFADCGNVYLCDLGSATYRGTTTPELCAPPGFTEDDLAAALEERFPGATCSPTPRGGALGWPCLYGCEKGHQDSNAYQGSYCN